MVQPQTSKQRYSRRQMQAGGKNVLELLGSGLFYFQQGDLNTSKTIFESILNFQPDNFDALHFLGLIAYQRQELDSGRKLIQKALAINPNSVEAAYNLGLVLFDFSEYEEALRCFNKSVALNSEFFQAFLSRGNTLKELGLLEESITSYDIAITIKPDFTEAHYNKGIALTAIKQLDLAVKSFTKAIQINFSHVDAVYNRANSYRDLKKFDRAISDYEVAIALKPNDINSLYNLGITLHESRDLVRCIKFYSLTTITNPFHSSAHNNLGVVLQEIQQLSLAVEHFDHAIALAPSDSEIYFNKSITTLMKGDYLEGFKLYENRWNCNSFTRTELKRKLSKELWLGQSPLKGKRILLFSEQGLGDTIQFCRFVKNISALGAWVILEVQKPLTKLLRNLDGVDELVSFGDQLPDFDFYCPLMSLPLALKLTLNDLCNQIPYLRIDSEKNNFWASQLQQSNRLKVGLVWSGGFRPNQPELRAINERRNLPIEYLIKFNNLNVEFHSLQKGEPAESEFKDLIKQGWMGPKIFDNSDYLIDFADTAALINHLDLVISVDTSTAHLAAALNKPVWLLNRFDTCWRWLIDRDDSPWYPSVRIFRQPKPGDWQAVVNEACDQLGKLSDSRSY